MEEATINKRIFMEIRVREGKVMFTSSERGNSADVTLWWKGDVGNGLYCRI